MVQPHPDAAPSKSQPEFLPMEDGNVGYESGEVLPPADEAGAAETRGQDFGVEEDRMEEPQPVHGDSMDVTMDVNIVAEKPDTEFEELLAALQRDEREQVREANREILSVIKSLGADRGKYGRERAKASKAVVSEIYSPPRVTAASKLLPELKLIPGFALDLTTADVDGLPWDFDSKVMRDRAMKKLKEEKP